MKKLLVSLFGMVIFFNCSRAEKKKILFGNIIEYAKFKMNKEKKTFYNYNRFFSRNWFSDLKFSLEYERIYKKISELQSMNNPDFSETTRKAYDRIKDQHQKDLNDFWNHFEKHIKKSNKKTIIMNVLKKEKIISKIPFVGYLFRLYKADKILKDKKLRNRYLKDFQRDEDYEIAQKCILSAINKYGGYDKILENIIQELSKIRAKLNSLNLYNIVIVKKNIDGKLVLVNNNIKKDKDKGKSTLVIKSNFPMLKYFKHKNNFFCKDFLTYISLIRKSLNNYTKILNYELITRKEKCPIESKIYNLILDSEFKCETIEGTDNKKTLQEVVKALKFIESDKYITQMCKNMQIYNDYLKKMGHLEPTKKRIEILSIMQDISLQLANEIENCSFQIIETIKTIRELITKHLEKLENKSEEIRKKYQGKKVKKNKKIFSTVLKKFSKKNNLERSNTQDDVRRSPENFILPYNVQKIQKKNFEEEFSNEIR